MGFPTEITFLLFYLAAVCMAVMDKVAHHYYKSVFKLIGKPYWWDKKVSWPNKYKERDIAQGRRKIFMNINYPVQLTDAWHFFKFLFVLFIICAVVFSGRVIGPGWDVIIYGAFFNWMFSLHYNYFFDLDYWEKVRKLWKRILS